MKDSVSGVFISKSKAYLIKRQNYLPAFPGYHAHPGGKLDEADSAEEFSDPIWPKGIPAKVLSALIREMKEELRYDLIEGIQKGEVLSIDDIGIATSPEFNPYRFKNYYLKITLTQEIDFDFDHNEVMSGQWKTPSEFLLDYYEGKILAIPPAIKILKALEHDLTHSTPINMSLVYDPLEEVPMIESLFGVRQFIPFSKTFPPANRTNAFIIGDKGERKILIDPSPKDEIELKKFLKSVESVGFDSIFLTHHHPDHFQFSREIALQYKVGIELSHDTYNRIGPDYFEGIEVTFRKEGDVVTKSIGEDVLVFEVPGHDEGQLALAPKSLRWFLVGDLVQTIGTVLIGAPEGNMKKYFETLERIIALDPQYIIPSHGIILGGTHKLVETLKHRKAREEQIIELVRQHKTEEEILHIVYKNISEKLMPYAKKTLDAHLLKLKDERRI